MKTYLALILALLCQPLFAHDHSIDLKPGQFVFDYNFKGSAAIVVGFGTMDYVDGEVVTYYRNIINAVPNTASPYDMLSLEFAPARGWSLGIKTSAIMAPILFFRDSVLNVQGSVFSNWRLTDLWGWQNTGWEAFWYEELQLTPLIGEAHEWSDGMINVFSTLSLNSRLLDQQGLVFSWYIDAKVTNNFPSPLYWDSWRSADDAVSFLELNSIPYSGSLQIIVVPTFSGFVAVGLEVLLGSFNGSIGLNVPMGTLERVGLDRFYWDMGALDSWNPMSALEFQLKWVL